MKSQNGDINLLLFSLLLFSLALGIFYNIRPKSITPQNSNAKPSISIENGLNVLNPYIISVSIEKIVRLMKQFPPEISYNIAKRIVEEKQSSLNNQQKQEVIFGLAQAFSSTPEIQHKLFDLLLEIEETKNLPALLIHAVNNGHGEMVGPLIKWAQSKQETIPELKDIGTKALFMTIDLNDNKALQALHEHGIPINNQTATDLLWHAVSENKSPSTVPFLIQLGANHNKCKEGHTLITKATELNNLTIIQAIITELQKKGIPQKEIQAFVNQFANPAIGSPLQIALEKRYTNIELYLRKQGGLEK